MQGSAGAILYCILAGFLLVLPGLAIPVFTQVFVDHVLVENLTEWLRPLILGMIITTVFQGLLTLLRLRYLRKLRIKLAVAMSTRFLWHILRLPVRFYAAILTPIAFPQSCTKRLFASTRCLATHCNANPLMAAKQVPIKVSTPS